MSASASFGTWSGHLLLGAILFIATILQGAVLGLNPWIAGTGMVATFTAFVLVWRHSIKEARKPPKHVVFEELETFRDLCARVTEGWRPLSGPICPGCRYPLIGLRARRCPECGRAFSANEFGMTEEELAEMLRPDPNDLRIKAFKA